MKLSHRCTIAGVAIMKTALELQQWHAIGLHLSIFADLLKKVYGSDTDKAELIGHADASMTKYYQSADFESMQKITDAL